MKVFLINNSGGGFAGEISVEAGTTAGELFKKQLPGKNPSNYLIRVNRKNMPQNQKLVENDTVTFTPTKIEGA